MGDEQNTTLRAEAQGNVLSAQVRRADGVSFDVYFFHVAFFSFAGVRSDFFLVLALVGSRAATVPSFLATSNATQSLEIPLSVPIWLSGSATR